MRTRASARELMGAEVVEVPPARTEAELRDLRYAVAARPPARDGPHGLRPGRDRALPARDERHDPRDQGRGARTASCARCCRSGARRPRRIAARKGWRGATDSTNPDTVRGLIRSELLPSLRRLHPAAESEHPARGRGAAPAAAGARGAARRTGRLEAARPRRRRAGRARVRPPLARAEPRCARRRGPVGPLADRLRAPRASGTVLEAGRPPCRTREEDSGCIRRREDPPFRARDLAARRPRRARSWPCPGSSRRRA